jgi:hypothetical protein
MSARRLALLALAPLLVIGALAWSSLRPSDDRVTIGFSPDATTIEECRAIGAIGRDPVPCYRQALANLAFEEGPAVALARFREESRAVPPLAGGCHPVAHLIGAAGLARSEGDIGSAFAGGDDSCASGYYHGVLEHAFAKIPSDTESLWSVAQTLCDAPSIRAVAFLSDQCFHGLGHGLMLSTDYDLPVANEVCSRFAEPGPANACYLGLFMENFAASYGVASRWVNDEDLGAICGTIEGRWKEIAKGACYNTLTYRIAARSNGSAPWSEYLAACTAIDPVYAGACYNGFGREVYTRYAADFAASYPAMRDACLLAPAQGALACVASVAGHVTYTDTAGERAAGFCAEFEGEYRSACFGEIGSFLATLEGGLEALEARCTPIARRPADLVDCLVALPIR